MYELFNYLNNNIDCNMNVLMIGWRDQAPVMSRLW